MYVFKNRNLFHHLCSESSSAPVRQCIIVLMLLQLTNNKRVASCIVANARPTAVSTFAVTESFAVVVWELPPTARGSDIQANFTATVTNGSSTVAMLTTNGTAIFLNSRDLIAPGRNVSVVVRATYQNPPGEVAVAPVFTFTVPQMDAGKARKRGI